MNKQYWVYIITNKARTTLYVGFTNDLERRMREHKFGEVDGFSKRYNLKCLVHYEEFSDPHEDIHREKKLKKWDRDSRWWFPRLKKEETRKS